MSVELELEGRAVGVRLPDGSEGKLLGYIVRDQEGAVQVMHCRDRHQRAHLDVPEGLQQKGKAMSPITQEPYFKVVCDECEEAFPEHESGGGYTLFETEKDAREAVTDYDGEIAADGKITCPSCVEERSPEPAQ
jgi:hypothetical protein